MVHVAPGDPPKPAHQKILEEEQAQLDHAHDVFPICRCIVYIPQADIDKGIFPDGSKVRQVLEAIITEAQEALMYQR